MIVLVKQYFDCVRDRADTMFVMDRGEVVLAGLMAELDGAQVQKVDPSVVHTGLMQYFVYLFLNYIIEVIHSVVFLCCLISTFSNFLAFSVSSTLGFIKSTFLAEWHHC